ncbi:hypothetical protein VTI74DRAFT_10343 [Chaetomium olivicolor]
MSTLQGSKPEDKDWSPEQYLLFRDARNRPINDLVTFLGPEYAPVSVVDLGCGPGNSTEILTARFPNAQITGVDSSPAMLTKARMALPTIDFTQADLRIYTPPPGTDLLFSNAVFHWLRQPDRIPTITRLLLSLNQGGILAFQMPDNYNEPSHRLMRETAASRGSWTPYFQRVNTEGQKPELDPIEPHIAYYNALKPQCRAVETWTTRYVHVLPDHTAIVEWVRGTGLQPFVNALPEGEVREAYLEEYRRRLEREYPRAEDGSVLLMYPRRFVVAFR